MKGDDGRVGRQTSSQTSPMAPIFSAARSHSSVWTPANPPPSSEHNERSRDKGLSLVAPPPSLDVGLTDRDLSPALFWRNPGSVFG